MLLAQDIQGVSIYADINLGMFQVAAMRVLTLQLRNENPDTLQSTEIKIYRITMFLCCLFWIGVLIDEVLSIACAKRASKLNRSDLKCLDAHLSRQGAQYLNGTWFAILFIMMVITGYPLCRVMQRVATSQVLSSNVKWLSMIFALWTFAFLSRAIYDYVTKMNGYFWTTFLGLALPLLWDFLPIFLMSLLHFRDQRIERRLQK